MIDETEGMTDSGARCSIGHPLWLVAEGYALCHSDRLLWYAWSLTPRIQWNKAYITRAATGQAIAWVYPYPFGSKAKAIAVIQYDMNEIRDLSFNETRERARLMPV